MNQKQNGLAPAGNDQHQNKFNFRPLYESRKYKI